MEEQHITLKTIVNSLLEHYSFSKYLEITPNRNTSICKISIPNKFEHYITYDDLYLNKVDSDTKFDLILIEGYGEEITFNIVKNALLHLNDFGIILVANSFPRTGSTPGDAIDYNDILVHNTWKTFLLLSDYDLDYYCIDGSETGCTIILKPANLAEIYDNLKFVELDAQYDYEFYKQNYPGILHLISLNTFNAHFLHMNEENNE